MSKFNLFVETNEKFIPYNVQGTHKELPSGAYHPVFDTDTGQVIFNKMKLNCDDIIDLPSKEYDYIVNHMNNFLKEDTKQKYIDNGFLYKRSVLLHGKPGTGKTVIVNRITKDALKKDAVVLFNPNPEFMINYFEVLEATAPNKLTVVIFEEFDDLVESGSRTEKALLSILDGEVQKNNIIYLATTNFIETIPLRMQRPGRFSSIIEVKYPSKEARKTFLVNKGIEESLLYDWVSMTDDFSIDELKETVLAVKCLDEKLSTVVSRIKELKNKGVQAESKERNNDLIDVRDDIISHLFGSSIKNNGRFK